MIFIDANVPMYLVGNAEVFQEILYRYRAIRRAGAIQPAFDRDPTYRLRCGRRPGYRDRVRPLRPDDPRQIGPYRLDGALPTWFVGRCGVVVAAVVAAFVALLVRTPGER